VLDAELLAVNVPTGLSPPFPPLAPIGAITDLEEGDVLRLFRERDQDDEQWTGQFNLNGIVETGFLKHNLLFSAEAQTIESDSEFAESDLVGAFLSAVTQGTASPFVLDASNPDLSPGLPPVTVTSLTDETLDTYGATVLDKIDIGEQVHLLIGGRYDVIEQTVITGTGTFAFEEDKFSPRLGAVVEPFASLPLSFFVSYTEGIRANRANADTNNVIPPQESTSYEAGFRYEFIDDKLAFTATAFDIEVENFPVTILGAGFLPTIVPSVLESQGIELSLQGQVTPELSVLANYTYTDAVFAEAPDLVEGTDTIGTPEHAASLVGKYKVLDGPYRGWFGTLGLLYQSERVGSAAFETPIVADLDGDGSPDIAERVLIDETTLPSFVRVDLTAGYEFESGATFEVGVKNLLDDEILQPSLPGFAFPEAPVTGFVRFKGKF